MKCINISHPEFKELLKESGIHPEILQTKVSLWMEDNNTTRFPKISDLDLSVGKVNATLKIVDALSKIQRNVYTLDKVQGWLNDLQKQGVSSQQLEFFKDTAKPGMTKDEIASSIAANYSYTIEINTAKENSKLPKQPHPMDGEKSFIVNGDKYSLISDVEFDEEGATNVTKAFKNDKEISIDEYLKGKQLAEKVGINTSYYSNLTVPGGTNYTENEIATPEIIPEIKGHAEFATYKGIGWFRSDDKNALNRQSLVEADPDTLTPEEFEAAKADFVTSRTSTTTRRILEVQSDLFQKGRERLLLTSYDLKVGDIFETDKGLIEVADILEGSQTINIKNLTTKTSQYLDRDTFITAYKK
jgi:hypothetical protein